VQMQQGEDRRAIMHTRSLQVNWLFKVLVWPALAKRMNISNAAVIEVSNERKHAYAYLGREGSIKPSPI
jgi:hypothetical protein